MKPLLAFLGFLFCISFSYAQEIETSSLPSAVTDIFSLLYPDANRIEWQLVNDQYQAEFKNNKRSALVLIAPDGTVLQTQTQIRTIALPEPALDYLEERFAEEKIDLATILEDEKGVITFTALVAKVDFTFDATGQLIDTHGVVTP